MASAIGNFDLILDTDDKAPNCPHGMDFNMILLKGLMTSLSFHKKLSLLLPIEVQNH